MAMQPHQQHAASQSSTAPSLLAPRQIVQSFVLMNGDDRQHVLQQLIRLASHREIDQAVRPALHWSCAKKDVFSESPALVQDKILQHLTLPDLLSASRVCRTWNHIVSNTQRVWCSHFLRILAESLHLSCPIIQTVWTSSCTTAPGPAGVAVSSAANAGRDKGDISVTINWATVVRRILNRRRCKSAESQAPSLIGFDRYHLAQQPEDIHPEWRQGPSPTLSVYDSAAIWWQDKELYVQPQWMKNDTSCYTLKTHSSITKAVVVERPDNPSPVIVAGTRRGTLELYDLGTGSCICRNQVHGGAVTSLVPLQSTAAVLQGSDGGPTYSPQVISAGADGTIVLCTIVEPVHAGQGDAPDPTTISLKLSYFMQLLEGEQASSMTYLGSAVFLLIHRYDDLGIRPVSSRVARLTLPPLQSGDRTANPDLLVSTGSLAPTMSFLATLEDQLLVLFNQGSRPDNSCWLVIKPNLQVVTKMPVRRRPSLLYSGCTTTLVPGASSFSRSGLALKLRTCIAIDVVSTGSESHLLAMDCLSGLGLTDAAAVSYGLCTLASIDCQVSA